ncbi:MAG: sigma-54 dependent transcriptional regulator [Acidobacteria bacterium]|nr:sigma-54 dependent transcriptional regulator [Acidobacteriota bacterium]
MNRDSILVVDDDRSLRRVTQMQLEDAGYEVFTAGDAGTALELMDSHVPSVVITDMKMPGTSGIELLRELRSRYPETTVILITAFGTVQTAVEAMRAGAYDYITKPIDYDELLIVLQRALKRRTLLDQAQYGQTICDDKFGFENIIGRSKPLLNVLRMAARAARTDSVVLLCGETGTGKELLARAIHDNSRRKEGPFAIINCGAIPNDLLESELFGHMRGSFTGAVADKRGRVEIAQGGTLFLDEIGELPLELQVKLLRLIQQGEIEKVGSPGSTRVDVRIIAATNRNLKAMVAEGTFREDLYYRLAVIPLDLPPLRDRAEDIPELTEYLFLQIKQKHGRPELRLPASLLPYFTGYDWPGNVRELENVIERLVVLTAANEIALDDLPEYLRREQIAVDELRLDLPQERCSLEGIEKELIVRALRKFSWNQTQAANYLDISRRTLIYRMEKYGLKK